MDIIVLIACSSSKLPHAAPARELYTSVLFRKSLAYAEALQPAALHVLSAKHGLVDADQVVEPYDLTLNAMRAAERERWGIRVTRALEQRYGTPVQGGGVWPPMGGVHFVILAGRTYRDPITPAIERAQSTWKAPLAGLYIGQQIAWLNKTQVH